MEATRTKARRSKCTALPKESASKTKQKNKEKEAFLYHSKISAAHIFSKHL